MYIYICIYICHTQNKMKEMHLKKDPHIRQTDSANARRPKRVTIEWIMNCAECMCVCFCVRVYISINIYTYLHIHTYMYIYIHIYIYIYIYVCIYIYIHTHTCVYIHVCLHIRINIYMGRCLRICLFGDQTKCTGTGSCRGDWYLYTDM